MPMLPDALSLGLRSPGSILSSPRLLISLPVGPAAAVSALVGGVAGLAWHVRGSRKQLPQLLDALSLPGLVALAVVSLGVRDVRSLPLAIAFALAAGLLGFLDRRAEFDGHRFLAAVAVAAFAIAWWRSRRRLS